MDQKEIEVINKNMVQLIKETDPNTVFLTELESQGVLGDSDMDKLKSIPSTHEKNRELYSILKTRTGSYNSLICALSGTMQTGLRDKLCFGDSSKSKELLNESRQPCSGTKLVTQNESPIPIMFHVTPPSQHFTGREKYLEQIRYNFSKKNTAAIICQSIVGLGGIGKTDLARKAVEQLIKPDENREMHVIWLKAETEQDLTSDFITLATNEKILGVDIKDAQGVVKDINTILKDVYTYFRNRRCLFVFDNAENEDYLAKFLPSSYPFLFATSTCLKPMVLITSRENEWSVNLNCSVVKLDLFSEDEAIQFVRKVLKLNNGSPNSTNEPVFVQQLICELEYLPLAIKQAAVYIAEQMKVDQNYGVKIYLEEWKQNSQKLLDKKIVGEEKTTYTTWKTTVEKIAKDESCGEVALFVLTKLAFMTPDGIKLELFQNNQKLGLSNVREAFALLLRYSMISQAGSGFSIHSLVQKVTRIDMKLNGREEYELERTLSMLTEETTSVNIPQVLSAWHHATRYGKLAVDYAHLPSLVANQLRNLKSLNYAVEFTKKELDFLYEALHEHNHLSILKLEASYCIHMILAGKDDFAANHRLWKKVQEVLKAGSASKWGLAVLLVDFCKLDREKIRYPDAWNSLDKILCSVHMNSFDASWAHAFFSYGICLYFSFDMTASTDFYNKALKIYERTQNTNMKLRQLTEHRLKLANFYTSKFDHTLANTSELLDSLCQLLNRKDHIDNNKLDLPYETSFLLFYKYGEIYEALSLCRYCAFIENHVDGPSIQELNILNQMSILLSEQGKFKEALDCSIKATALFKAENQNRYAFIETEYTIHLARALLGLGRKAESLDMIVKVVHELLSTESRSINLIPLIFMNLVAAEVLISNQENYWVYKIVDRTDKLLSRLPKNVSMPFFTRRLIAIKQRLVYAATVEVENESFQNSDSAATTPRKKRRII